MFFIIFFITKTNCFNYEWSFPHQVEIISFILGENTILVPIFLGHNQFGPYIFVAVSLVPIIFNLQSIWSLSLTTNGIYLCSKRCALLAHLKLRWQLKKLIINVMSASEKNKNKINLPILKKLKKRIQMIWYWISTRTQKKNR